MYTGVIVESSLTDPSFLNTLNITKTWQNGSWTLYKVQVSELQINHISESLAVGPWYTHFWDESKENIIVVFQNKIFHIKTNNQTTWEDAITYGRNLGVPPEQLDFLIDQDL